MFTCILQRSNSKHWFTTSFLQPLPHLVTPHWGSRKLSANEQFFVGAQTVASSLQTTQIKQGVSFTAANKVYTSTNKTSIVWNETELSFLTRGGCVSCLRACLGDRLLPQSYQYPNFSEGADRVSGQLRGDKEYPFGGRCRKAMLGVCSTLCYFHGLVRTQTFRRALTASVDSCTLIIKSAPFSDVTGSGRVWSKVPGSDGRTVGCALCSFCSKK